MPQKAPKGIKAPSKKAASKSKSTPKTKPSAAPKSKPSPPKPKTSRDFLKGESYGKNLTVIPLSSTGKPLKKSSGKPVIYGIREKGKKVKPLDMAPQTFRRSDLTALNELVKASADAQGTTNPKLAFFQTKVEGQFEKTKQGRTRKVTVKAGPLKGQKVPVFKTEMKFETPPPDAEWRQLFYEGPKFSHAIHKNLQKRNVYEIVKSQMLGKEGFSEFKDAHSRFVGGYETRDVTLRGRTLTEALRHIQVPVDSLWLEKKKVILKTFRENQIGNIFVQGNVNVTAKGKRFTVPVEISARYLSDLPNEIGRAIRQKLADQGATFTTPRELALIEQGAWRKLKSLRGGLKSQKARREMQRLTQPGFNPKAPKLKASLERIAKGKQDADEFPLTPSDSVKVNLRFSFYRDPLAKPEKKKAASKKKKRGTK
jgi:hypothetical protein